MRPDAIEIPRSNLIRMPDEPGQASAWATFGRFAGGAGRWLLRALRSPRTDLNEFSDVQLRDIGLSRIDVEQPGSAMRSIVRRLP